MAFSKSHQSYSRDAEPGRMSLKSGRRIPPETEQTETQNADTQILWNPAPSQNDRSRRLSRIPLPITPHGSTTRMALHQRVFSPGNSSSKTKGSPATFSPPLKSKWGNLEELVFDQKTSKQKLRSPDHSQRSTAERNFDEMVLREDEMQSHNTYRSTDNDRGNRSPLAEHQQPASKQMAHGSSLQHVRLQSKKNFAPAEKSQFDKRVGNRDSDVDTEYESSYTYSDDTRSGRQIDILSQSGCSTNRKQFPSSFKMKQQTPCTTIPLPTQHDLKSSTALKDRDISHRPCGGLETSEIQLNIPNHLQSGNMVIKSEEVTEFRQMTEGQSADILGHDSAEPPSSLEHELLLLRIENASLKQSRQDNSRAEWSTLHRITCTNSDSTRIYVDEPILIDQKSAGHYHLDSRIRIANDELWLRRHPEAPFIVYKDYACLEGDDNHEATRGMGTGIHRWDPENTMIDGSRLLTDPIREEVRVSSERLSELVSGLPSLTRSLDIYWQNEIFANETFEAPYLFYYHSRDAIQNFAASLEGQDGVLFALLLSYFEQHCEDASASIVRSFSTGVARSHMMPYLFAPGELLVITQGGSETFVARQIALVRGTVQNSNRRHGRTKDTVVWIYTIARLTFDGRFLETDTEFSIEVPKGGDFAIAKLSAYPLRYTTPALKRSLLSRGLTFYSCSRNRYVTCLSDTDGTGRHLAEARYMVDVPAFHMMHPDSPRPEGREVVDLGQDDEDFILQMPVTIQGFRLSNKRWRVLPAKDIKPVSWNKDAFKDLAISDGHKLLIQALVRNKISYHQGIDFVDGKGTGLVVLLHGPPGTGKTLTAETVAEIAEKPLYRVTCGDVGTDAVEIEKYLESVFHLGKRWECVVLLDEADVFLEQRTIDNLQRNALVSAFLRLIEFYDGILILTTNRVGTFDDAFKSRIQLALRYERLNDDQRKRIWLSFIERLNSINERMELSQIRAKVTSLAQLPMNGREIRNTINTARQLARFQGRPLSYEHIEKVVETQREFEEYIREVRQGIDDEEFKRELGER